MSRFSRSLAFFLAVFLAVAPATPAFSDPGDPKPWRPWGPGTERWEYNPGPDPTTKEGRELIEIYNNHPDYFALSNGLMDAQKFRYVFGMMLTRAYFGRNSVKILFIGQDATHIAEAAKQPGTSGFGARVQSIGNYFGVDQGVATTNAYVSTIKGQYGAFDHLYVEVGADGAPQIRQSSYVDNELWMMTNGDASEIVLQRERFWEWLLKYNPDSLKLVVVFGGAARDAWARFLIKRGAEIEPRVSPERLAGIQIPETKLVYAGGNNQFPVPIDRNGNDIYEILLGKKLDYTKPEVQEKAVAALKAAGQKGIDMMVFTGGGLNGSGLMDSAQLGGYDLNRVKINGEYTHSLKGLRLSDGTVIKTDIGFASSSHPTALSKMTPDKASADLKRSFSVLEELKAKGWMIDPDLGPDGKPFVNNWHEGIDYRYGRADIRQGYFEFGSPDDRRVSRAEASRLDEQTIVAGTRSKVKYDQRKLGAALKSKPSKDIVPTHTRAGRKVAGEAMFRFDRGPGQEIAKEIMLTLDRDAIFALKPGYKPVLERGVDVSFKTHGIDAYFTKTHRETGFFGIHRGSFEKSKALILADPHGLDDWMTSRAMTGARGQYLNGMMEDLGFGEDYLVLKTAPVGMDGATAEEWEHVRKSTEKYRETAIEIALRNPEIETIFTDGPIAKKEMQRILKKLKVKGKTVIDIAREGMDPSSGIEEGIKIAKTELPSLSRVKAVARMSDIPRSHLTFWSMLRPWEGTGGDLVLDTLGKDRGGAKLVVAPDWVAKEKFPLSEFDETSIRRLQKELDDAGIRYGRETLEDFLNRKGLTGDKHTFGSIEEKRALGVKPTKPRRGRRAAEGGNPMCPEKMRPPTDFPVDEAPL